MLCRLQPEIELMNPAEGSKRISPLERSLDEQHKLAKSLNVDYKMGLMRDLRSEAQKLQEKGQQAVDNMNKVSCGTIVDC